MQENTEAVRHLNAAAAASRRDSFIEESQPTISDPDALGVAVSKWAEWDGNQIAETFFSALEDANYHAVRAKMVDFWNTEVGTDFH